MFQAFMSQSQQNTNKIQLVSDQLQTVVSDFDDKLKLQKEELVSMIYGSEDRTRNEQLLLKRSKLTITKKFPDPAVH